MATAKPAAKKTKRPPAKPLKERVAEWRERQTRLGLAEVRSIYAHPDDHPEIKQEAARINRRRERAGKRA